MGIILGYLCAICFILLAGKAITHRCHFTKQDKVLMRLHKPLSAAMLVLSIVHFIVVIPVLQTRSMMVNLSGIAMLVVVILLIGLCHMIKQREKRMWWHRCLTIVIAVLLVGHFATWLMDFVAYQQKLASIEIPMKEVDITQVQDGIYEGEYDAGYIYAKVQVEIKAGKIVSLSLLEHRNERGKPAEVILDEVMEKQQIDVDAVSGATNSSKVIKQAITNALKVEG